MLTDVSPKSTRRARNQGSALIEFGPALFVMLLIFVFPLINLLMLATGYATIALLTNETASQASTQPDYNRALSAMSAQAKALMSTGFVHFAKLKPIGGYQNCGTDLYVQATNYRGGGSNTVGPNIPLPPPVDSSSFIYEYQTRAAYQMDPFVNLSAVPYIGNVPGLGKPVKLAYTVSKATEHPDGLDNGVGENPTLDNSTVTAFNRTPVNTNPATTDAAGVPIAGTGDSGWNYPGIYQAIAQAGEVVVCENVVVVQSTSYAWTDSACAATTGEQVWFDYRANGIASIGPQWGGPYGPAGYGSGTTIAQQTAALGPGASAKYFNFPPGSLIGKMGGTTAANTGAAPYEIGPGLYNYSPTSAGEVFLRYDDSNVEPSWFADNKGEFIVRVIVTRMGP